MVWVVSALWTILHCVHIRGKQVSLTSSLVCNKVLTVSVLQVFHSFPVERKAGLTSPSQRCCPSGPCLTNNTNPAHPSLRFQTAALGLHYTEWPGEKRGVLPLPVLLLLLLDKRSVLFANGALPILFKSLIQTACDSSIIDFTSFIL